MARLLKNGNIVQTIKEAYTAGKEKDADAQKIGMDAIMGIMCACTDVKIEEQFYDLLGGICERTPAEIKEQSLETTIEDIKKICKENNIANFWNSASSLSVKM